MTTEFGSGNAEALWVGIVGRCRAKAQKGLSSASRRNQALRREGGKKNRRVVQRDDRLVERGLVGCGRLVAFRGGVVAGFPAAERLQYAATRRWLLSAAQ